MGKRTAFFIFLFVIGVCGQLKADDPNPSYERVWKFEDLKTMLEGLNLTTRDIVVFDVDQVLTVPRDPLLQIPSLSQYRREFRALIQKLPKGFYDVVKAYFVLQSPQQLSDERMPELVNYCADKAHQIYLTALLTGSLPRVVNIAEWRAYSLVSAGFQIYKDEHDARVYSNFVEHFGSFPKRTGTLLMTNGAEGGISKGLMLTYYMKEKGLRPERVIVIEDRVTNLENIESHLVKHYPGVEFIGIDYKAAYKGYPVPPGYEPPTKQAFRKKMNSIYELCLIAINDIKEKQK